MPTVRSFATDISRGDEARAAAAQSRWNFGYRFDPLRTVRSAVRLTSAVLHQPFVSIVPFLSGHVVHPDRVASAASRPLLI